jgi:2,4-dienoyl-CoA reductase-like NADH-dependent reductase (Old Yellow Enzyme family)
MANNLADENGRVTPALQEHYGKHARGGAALVIVEHAYVAREGRVDEHQLGAHEDANTPGLASLARRIHDGGALAVMQITHGGARCPQAATGQMPQAPSDVTVPGDEETPRPLSQAEIEQLPVLFAAAARRAIEAGFDGVEVHGAHGYLLNEFLSPVTNRRTDAYGGEIDGRLRVIQEVLEAVREALGLDSLLLYRFPADDGVPGGLSPEDGAKIAPRLVAWGVDLVDCSGGLCGSRPSGRQEQGFFVQAAGTVRRGLRAASLDTPVSGVGGVIEPAFAQRVIEDDLIDAVCVGRAQLRDPAWPRKALVELGQAS